jgi:heme exporter protein A
MSTMRVENLAIARGDRLLVEALDFAVAPGEILHLRGRNGAGKTSLLEALCGLRTPAQGRIVDAPAASARHWIGHRNALNPMLTADENLRFWCDLNGVARADTGAALARLGLKGQRHRPCAQLSTGQRRRAALARLVAAPRPWWFLDEPLAGLDASGLELFAELLQAHAAQGGAVVVTSHQPFPLALTIRELVLQPRRPTAVAA